MRKQQTTRSYCVYVCVCVCVCVWCESPFTLTLLTSVCVYMCRVAYATLLKKMKEIANLCTPF